MTETTKQRIPTNANSREIANSVYETIDKINLKGESTNLNFELQFKFARFKFSIGEFDEANKLLGICNSMTIDYGLPENYEIYYWAGRISEQKGEIDKAKTTYEITLRKCNDNPSLISRTEIIEALERTKKPS